MKLYTIMTGLSVLVLLLMGAGCTGTHTPSLIPTLPNTPTPTVTVTPTPTVTPTATPTVTPTATPTPTPTATPTVTATAMALVGKRFDAETMAFDICVARTSEEHVTVMKQLLSPITDKYYWRYDNSITMKTCLFGFKGNEITGELYFITNSASGAMELSTIKWQSAP